MESQSIRDLEGVGAKSIHYYRTSRPVHVTCMVFSHELPKIPLPRDRLLGSFSLP